MRSTAGRGSLQVLSVVEQSTAAVRRLDQSSLVVASTMCDCGASRAAWDRAKRLGGNAAGTCTVIASQMSWRKRRGHIQRHSESNGLEEAHSASNGLDWPGGSAAGTFSVITESNDLEEAPRAHSAS